MASYIPTRDVELGPWADNFRDLTTADPVRYGITAGQAAEIAPLVNTWDTAYATASNPATRTPASIAAKDSAKGAMIPVLRLYAQLIKANNGVTNEDKVSLGIHVNDPIPTPVPVPTSIPKLSMNAAFHLNQTLDIRATETPLSRAKPPGVAGLELARTVTLAADPTPADPDAADFVGIATKNLKMLQYSADLVGKRATFWGRWFNRKGELGPWSLALSQIMA